MKKKQSLNTLKCKLSDLMLELRSYQLKADLTRVEIKDLALEIEKRQREDEQ